MNSSKCGIYLIVITLVSVFVSANIGIGDNGDCAGKDITDNMTQISITKNGWSQLYQSMHVNEVHTTIFNGLVNNNPNQVTLEYDLFYCKRDCDKNDDGMIDESDKCFDYLVKQDKKTINQWEQIDFRTDFKPAQEGCYQLDWRINNIPDGTCSYEDKSFCRGCTFWAYLVDVSCVPGNVITKTCGITDVGECSYGTYNMTCEETDFDIGPLGVWKKGGCFGNINPVEEVCDGKDNDCDGYTDEGVCPPPECETNEDCDNGVYCDGMESCVDGICVSGISVDCSGNNIFGISTCFYSPESNPFTFDFREEFTSYCDEGQDKCTEGSNIVLSSCNKEICYAECTINSDCGKTECDVLDGCYEEDYYDYSDVMNYCVGCLCTSNQCSIVNITEEDPRCIHYECTPGDTEVQSCGISNVGECSYGSVTRICEDGYWTDWSECIGAVYPTTEICDGKDNDCDGYIDENGCEDCTLEKVRLDGKNGYIDYINEFTDINFSKKNIKFNAWVNKEETGYVIVSITAETKDKGKLSLKFKGKVRDVYENDCDMFSVENSWWSLATYRAPGSKVTKKIDIDSIWYELNRKTNRLDLYGTGPDVNFKISNIEIKP